MGSDDRDAQRKKVSDEQTKTLYFTPIGGSNFAMAMMRAIHSKEEIPADAVEKSAYHLHGLYITL
jgi:hypothetical protein